ncbi:MAG TPA: Tim44/TimA family putative adaptor protein [Rhizomicrobium sp.]
MPDSQTLGLLAAAMVAAIVLFRLYTILGRRTGHEPQPPVQRAPLTPVAPPAASEPQPSSSGLLEIQIADPAFDTPKFLAGAREAYAQIVTAFAAGDRAQLRPLLSPDVYAAFDTGITSRSGPAPTLIKLHDARIVGSALHGRSAEITAAFTAEFSGGDDKNTVTDVWTFERNLDSTDPNWTLVATSGELPE